MRRIKEDQDDNNYENDNYEDDNYDDYYNKQDQVNNANSAFIFMINLLIIQGCQSGSVGRGDQLVKLVRLIWWSR